MREVQLVVEQFHRIHVELSKFDFFNDLAKSESYLTENCCTTVAATGSATSCNPAFPH